MELLAGIFLRMRLSRTRLVGPTFPEPCELALPVLLATDCDLLLGESALLTLPRECRRFDIYVMLAFFLD